MSIFKKGGLIATAVLIFGLAACASTAKQEGTGGYVDDSVVTAKVKAELLREPDVSSLQVKVETFKGVVQLSGFVDNATQRHRAVEVASRVSGVVKVKDDILLR